MKAVLFDLDGTLTNTLQDIATAMNRALRMNGLPEYPTDAYRYLVGNGAKILAQRAVGDRQELAGKVQQDYQAYYETHNQVTTKPYDGVPEMLHALSQMGLKLCVLSNKPHADTCHVVAHYFSDIAFAQVRGQMEGVPVKPDPTGALAIAESLGIAPKDFLYLGDTAVDMHCAGNAGMCSVGVKWGFRDEKELREAGAAYVIDTPMQAVEIAKQA